MTYILRDAKGVMKAKLSNVLAGQMLKHFDGRWVEKKYVSGKTRLAFVFSGDYSCGKVSTVGIEVFVWKDDYIVAED